MAARLQSWVCRNGWNTKPLIERPRWRQARLRQKLELFLHFCHASTYGLQMPTVIFPFISQTRYSRVARSVVDCHCCCACCTEAGMLWSLSGLLHITASLHGRNTNPTQHAMNMTHVTCNHLKFKLWCTLLIKGLADIARTCQTRTEPLTSSPFLIYLNLWFLVVCWFWSSLWFVQHLRPDKGPLAYIRLIPHPWNDIQLSIAAIEHEIQYLLEWFATQQG